MSLNYLFDENVNPLYLSQIHKRRPDLIVWAIGQPNTPSKGTLDPEILIWCEEYNFILVTNNRTSMPVHLTNHIRENRHVPGIFILNPNLSIGDNIEQLIFMTDASFDHEYQDQIIHLTKF